MLLREDACPRNLGGRHSGLDVSVVVMCMIAAKMKWLSDSTLSINLKRDRLVYRLFPYPIAIFPVLWRDNLYFLPLITLCLRSYVQI
jgi:hypothetical protein